ncbi:unnamed protein product [[Candida] boidinii]|uniref:peptidylprolyl isomerase n=1 Tax=Candida boidinii TaxID=5477 RepID=A0A9W6WFP6_CANBO|nr:hypothetical protein B5S30_g3493 [[Candida] boidinii]OWB83361.1 hypothetical protein B5S33_g1990 [[Candida] boidinii]GME68328.1 unnamed protein product [[Candida] boidinii]GMF64049.1 unnamed protein product [[Candida] boidinii]GMF97721.1 unnamed protein product [[Candida] boidinii]
MQLKQLLFVILLGLIAYVQAKSSDQLQIGILKKIPDTECPRKSKNGDKVSMHYIGTLADGTKFDASYDRGTPLEFTLGVGQVIKGWDQGLLEYVLLLKSKLIT